MKQLDRLVEFIIKNDLFGLSYKIEAGPFFIYIKKHYCFKCGHKLKRKISGRTVTPQDPDYDFDMIDAAPLGNVYLTRTIFECDYCGEEYENGDLQFLELTEEKKQKIKVSRYISDENKIKNFKTFAFIVLLILFIIVIPLLFKLKK